MLSKLDNLVTNYEFSLLRYEIGKICSNGTTTIQNSKFKNYCKGAGKEWKPSVKGQVSSTAVSNLGLYLAGKKRNLSAHSPNAPRGSGIRHLPSELSILLQKFFSE